MKNIATMVKLTKEEENELKKNFRKQLEDHDFRELVCTLNVGEEVLMKYTSSLEDASKEFRNCKNCKGLTECKNHLKGYLYTPSMEQDEIIFSYRACSYQEKYEKDTKYQKNVALFASPKRVREANLKDIYRNDRNRVEFMKYVNEFVFDYMHGKNPKGIYLHGSYGTGKTYLIAALFNELAKKEVKSAIVYVPDFLRMLKSSMANEAENDFEDRYDYIKKIPLLLLDDIGAEYLTPWARDEILGTILQYRMDEELPTFFTSNLNLKQLEEHFSITANAKEEIKGRRMIERIKDLTKEFELVGESNRK